MYRFLWMLGLVLCAGCSNSQKSKTDSDLIVGYQLIDSNRADEAVSHFTLLNNQDPKNQDYIRGLGSAYSARAGFKIQNLTGPIQEITALDGLKKNYSELAKKWIELDPRLDAVKNVIELELEIISFARKLSLIPDFNTEQTADLNQAISIYQSIDELSEGDCLYIAVLKTFLLKSKLLQNMPVLNCKQLALAVQKRFLELASSYSSIISYLKLSQPSKAEAFGKQEVQIALALNEVNALTSNSQLAFSIVNIANSNSNIGIFRSIGNCH